MTNKLLALLLPAALTIAQIAEAKKPRQIPDWYPDKDSLYRAVESIPPFGIYKDNYIVTGTSFSGGRVTKDNSDDQPAAPADQKHPPAAHLPVSDLYAKIVLGDLQGFETVLRKQL